MSWPPLAYLLPLPLWDVEDKVITCAIKWAIMPVTWRGASPVSLTVHCVAHVLAHRSLPVHRPAFMAYLMRVCVKTAEMATRFWGFPFPHAVSAVCCCVC